jgi:hypothetical protein
VSSRPGGVELVIGERATIVPGPVGDRFSGYRAR